jgi:hypothetical protein
MSASSQPDAAITGPPIASTTGGMRPPRPRPRPRRLALGRVRLQRLLSGELKADLVDMPAEAGALADAVTCRVELERVVDTTLALWLPWLPGHVHELGDLLGAGQRRLGHDADPGRVDLLVDNAGFDPGELQRP